MNSRELLELWQAGESQAATEIFNRYVARLVALARSRISKKLRRRVDPQDVVQSAYRSFFVHARQDEFQVERAGDLWRLLAKITLHKLHRQIERQTAAKRALARDASLDLVAERAVAVEPSAAEAVAFAEELQLAVRSLLPNEQKILAWMLAGWTESKMASELGKSERTVRRLLAAVERKFEDRLRAADQPRRPKSTHAPTPDAPLQFSDYTLERMIAAGGMGKVFRARDKRTGKPVAIKALHKSRQLEERAIEMFVQEANILSKLSHPNIVGVRGLGRFPSGGYFLVMDFVDGTDLQTRVERAPISIDESIRLMRDIASAVGYAHTRGVIHCDLKPANILVDDNGRAVVSDFGFAQFVAAESKASRLGGTVGYMAPEVLLHHAQPTTAADVYAMGMLFWTLLTGDPPGRLDRNAPLDLALAGAHALCMRCTSQAPADRLQTADEFLSGLERLRPQDVIPPQCSDSSV
ncbi:MAG TPA: protein kinase [Pirellulales bacterium]